MLNINFDSQEFSPDGFPLQKFTFGNQEVRVLLIQNEPWFVLSDLAKVLEHSTPSKLLKRLDTEDIKGMYSLHTLKGKQKATVISENGMYSVLLGSRKEVAKPFQKWVTKEVLPSIRKTGSYQLQEQPQTPQTFSEALFLAAKIQQEKELLEAENQLLIQANEKQAEIIDELFDYSSIIRIAKYNNCSEKNFSWHRLKAASQALGKEIKTAPCPRFGKKNLYSHEAWRLAYPDFRLPETTTLLIKAS